MAKSAKGTGLVYRGDEGTWSVYEMWYENRVIFEASVCNTDPNLKIWVGQRGATWAMVHDVAECVTSCGALIATKGRAQRGIHTEGGVPGEVPDGLHEHVDGATMQSYVYPRLTFLLATIFVPVKPDLAPQPDALGDVDSGLPVEGGSIDPLDSPEI